MSRNLGYRDLSYEAQKQSRKFSLANARLILWSAQWETAIRKA